MKNPLRDVNVKEFVGHKIVEVRHMTQIEAAGLGFDEPDCAVLVILDNGTVLFPQRDPEGNGPGTLCYLLGDSRGDGIVY